MDKEGDSVAVVILLFMVVDPHLTPNGDRTAGLMEVANLCPRYRV